MTRFMKTFLFLLFVGNAFAVVPRALDRFAGLEPMAMLQRVSLYEAGVIACAYLAAMTWAASNVVMRRREAAVGARG